MYTVASVLHAEIVLVLESESDHIGGNRAGYGFIIGGDLHEPVADPWVRRHMHERNWWALSQCLGDMQAPRCTYLHGNFSIFMSVMKKATFKDVAPEKSFVEFHNTVAKVSQWD